MDKEKEMIKKRKEKKRKCKPKFFTAACPGSINATGAVFLQYLGYFAHTDLCHLSYDQSTDSSEQSMLQCHTHNVVVHPELQYILEYETLLFWE